MGSIPAGNIIKCSNGCRFIAAFYVNTFVWKIKEIIALLLICFYFILIIYKIQFPIFINNDVMETELGGIKLGRDVNLIPFKDFAHMTSLLNIVMFIPIGFLQGFVVKNNWKKTIIVGFILSLVVESSQLLVNMLIGYNFRTFDVNDLIFNTIGALIGYLILFGIISLLKKVKSSDNRIIEYIKSRG